MTRISKIIVNRGYDQQVKFESEKANILNRKQKTFA